MVHVIKFLRDVGLPALMLYGEHMLVCQCGPNSEVKRRRLRSLKAEADSTRSALFHTTVQRLAAGWGCG
jgi:hypothetical protein